MKLIGYGITDIGRVKQVNQDSLFYAVADDGKSGVFAVADGVGGLKFGEVASAKATEHIAKWWRFFYRPDFIKDMENVVDSLSHLIYVINKDVYAFNEANQTQSATTLSLILLFGESYCIAHVGDSRVYACVRSENRIYQLTTDHSRDIIREKNGRKFVQSALTDGIGHKKSIKCDLYFGPLNSSVNGFLVCSDGIYKRQNEQQIANILFADEPNACSNLILGAKQAGESDNITAAFVNIDYEIGYNAFSQADSFENGGVCK